MNTIIDRSLGGRLVAHLYHTSQQKLRYEIVKNRSRNT